MNNSLALSTQKTAIIAKFNRIKQLQNTRDNDRLKSISITDGFVHVFGYTRVSTKMQLEDGSSLSCQKRTIEQYCEKNDYKLDNVYTDAALSGGNKERPDFNKMLVDLKPGMKVIVTSADRFARSIAHVIEFKNIIHERKCSILILDSKLDTSDQIGDVIFNILSCFAELERKNTKAKISSTMIDKSRQGTLRGKPCFGWKMNKDDKDHPLIMDEEEQEIIDVIRDILKEDPKITLTEIARRLEIYDIKIRKCSRIYPTTIKNIIDSNNLRPNKINDTI
jgi:DNA invertase Pin-like site-specific DNA recombinase